MPLGILFSLGMNALAKKNQQNEQQQRSQGVQSLLGRPAMDLPPSILPPPKVAEGQGLLGGKMTPEQFHGGLLSVPGMEKIGAQGLLALQRDKMGGGSKYGLNPFYYRAPDGTMKAAQLTSQGGLQDLQLPEGATIPEGIKTIDLGGQQVILGARSGAEQGRYDIGVDPTAQFSQAQQNQRQANQPQIAAETTRATSLANDQVKAPGEVARLDQSMALISNMIAHPGREFATGMSSTVPRLPGTEAKNYELLVDQVLSDQFLNAIEQMKGMGQLSDAEGKKIATARTSLSLEQSDAAHKAELQRILTTLEEASLRNKAKLQGSAIPAAAPPPPPGFQIVE